MIRNENFLNYPYLSERDGEKEMRMDYFFMAKTRE